MRFNFDRHGLLRFVEGIRWFISHALRGEVGIEGFNFTVVTVLTFLFCFKLVCLL